MDIVIIANFCGDFQESDNNRFRYLAALLSKDHQVELITSDFLHSAKKYREECFDPRFQITMLHEPAYPRNVCLKRFYSHWVLGKSVKKYLETRKKPDAIYCAIPSLDVAKEAADYAHRNGVFFALDVQDLWPEAFKMVFRVPVLGDLIFAPMMHMAELIYKKVDVPVAVSRAYCDRVLHVNHKCKDGLVVYIGTNLADFDEYTKRDIDIVKPKDEVWLAYCGTLGNSYDLPCVFRALLILRERGIKPPKLIIMGDGPRQSEFELYVAQHNLDVCFTGRVPYEQMCRLLCICDITVNPIAKGSAASIINKHADYAASGKPVLNTQESAEYRALVEEYQMGFNCGNGDAEDLAEKMLTLMQSPELCREMGQNARRCAEERFDRAATYQQIADMISREVRQKV